MIKLCASLIIAGDGTISASNGNGDTAANRNGVVTYITNMTTSSLQGNQADSNDNITVGTITFDSYLKVQASYAPNLYIPVVGGLEDIRAGEYGICAIDNPVLSMISALNPEQKQNNIAVYRIADLYEGFDQILIKNNTAATLNGYSLQIGNYTQTLKINGLDSGEYWTVCVPDAMSVSVVNEKYPDLTISSFSAPGTVENNVAFNLTFQISNYGKKDAAASTLYLYDGNVKIGEIIVEPIAAGDRVTKIYSVSAGLPDIGSHILKLVADGKSNITETNEENNSAYCKVTSIISTVPENLQVTTKELSWSHPLATDFRVEISQDTFAHVFALETAGSNVDLLGISPGTYQWRVGLKDFAETTQGNNFTVTGLHTPEKLISDADGNMDVFFAENKGTWSSNYSAQHQGIKDGWKGSGEQVKLAGKNIIADVFAGSSDANVLVLTDSANGDALFVEDVFTAFGKDSARIAQIDEIRAGAGDDVVDLTSQKFAYNGSGVKVYGGLGNDTIWANEGENILFGDAGNDRIVGGSANDLIVGGIGNDSLHGGGGNDIFCFGDNFGKDTVEQLADGKVILWFESGSESNWNASTLTYSDGNNSVKVSGVTADKITLKFGDDQSALYDKLAANGSFDDAASEKIFEDKNKGFLA
ncbi:MAG: hypothetical protein E7056_02990 [Lentisphaerae bacterium]|nr:hypothetical protein [Lentisphaerota bacterium]